MNYRMSQRDLNSEIRKSGAQSIESRQVAKRLAQLLPSRLSELKRELTRVYGKVAISERHALNHQDYLKHLNDLNTMRFQALEARIEYETHLMLFQARQTLTKLRRF